MHTQFELIYLILLALILYLFCRSNEPDWKMDGQMCGPGHGLGIVCGSAAIVFILPGVLWTHASTTTACNRLPSLVTLCEVEDEEEDSEWLAFA